MHLQNHQYKESNYKKHVVLYFKTLSSFLYLHCSPEKHIFDVFITSVHRIQSTEICDCIINQFALHEHYDPRKLPPLLYVIVLTTDRQRQTNTKNTNRIMTDRCSGCFYLRDLHYSPFSGSKRSCSAFYRAEEVHLLFQSVLSLLLWYKENLHDLC